MQAYVSPTDPLVAELVERLDASQREACEERAAIMQFDGQTAPRSCRVPGAARSVVPASVRVCAASPSWRSNWMAARNGC